MMWNKTKTKTITPIIEAREHWVLLYTTTQYTEAAIIQGKLSQNHIPVRVLNKQDSMYPVFGDIEIFVPIHLLHVAGNVLNEALKN